ncbi:MULTISPECIES: glycoside hydrolase family 19 protein [Pseudomonas]|uniref:glycoside hydrolase family 19 protein n=1 Tax=Pseudomonas TaxID=286 RepID=UPI00129B10DD|nr:MULTISPECIES: glycoside hydrolase family 19 protein [Pseudomonas]MBH3459623.1 glycoside hydrolase family 19 protein [Pseudomonas putida]MBK0060414.1 glycoside hydrolase family 19 protein [Pseudomonas sp. S44]
MLTERQLIQIYPLAGQRVGTFLTPLNEAMARWEIDHPKRIAAFLAQVGHESDQLRYVKELGSDRYLSRYDTGPLALRLGNTPEADGDGQLYCGRGLIQVTGRNNYQACSRALFGDERLLAQPQLLEQPRWACESAAWFWQSRGLNALADRGEFNRITRHINGGLNGLDERLKLWARAREVLC